MIQVILVDDHAVVRQGIRKAIEVDGDIVVVGEASSGVEALQVVTRTAADVVVMDVTMPNGDGFEAARKIRRKKGAPAVVMLSMHDGEEYARRATEAGASGYVDKGAGIAELADAIRAVHRGETYRSQRIVPSDPSNAAALESLTPREVQVLTALAAGKTNHEVAEGMSISVKTVDTHRRHLLRKLGMRNNSDLTRFAIQNGLVTIEGG